MFVYGLMAVDAMWFMRSSVTCEKFSLNLLEISVGSVNTMLFASSSMVGNFPLDFFIWFKVFHVDLKTPFERFKIFE